MSVDLLFKETGLREVAKFTSKVRERQVHLYWHVARLLAKDLVHRIFFLPGSGAKPRPEGALMFPVRVRWNPNPGIWGWRARRLSGR